MRSIFRRPGLRVAQLTIAITLLVAPASAFALAGATSSQTTAQPATLPVHVSPRHVRLGRRVTISGRAVRAAAGRTVQLQSAARRGGRWRVLASTRVAAGGHYAFHVRLRHSRVLRAVEVPGTVPDTRDPARTGGVSPALAAARAASAVSPAKPVAVQARLRVSARQRGVRADARVRIAGHLLPGRAGRTVALQGRAGRRWHTLARGRTGRRGGFSVGLRADGAAVQRHLRVRFAGDRANARVTHGAGGLLTLEPVVASWYEDGGSTACGFHATDGVANRTLPCGTKVTFEHRGRTVTATVDDRGPYVYGRQYDLNQNTAAALDFSGVGTVYERVH